MDKKVIGLVAFVTGAAIGSLVTWRILKERYEKLAEEDSKSIREAFARRMAEPEEIADEPTEVDFDELKNVSKQLSADLGYDGAITEDENEEKGEPVAMDKPYVIDPFESGNGGEYEIISLTYYADEVLVDDSGNLIEDVEAVVGVDSLTHFGEYEDDSVFVRDDDLKIDYEILRDYRRYSEIKKSPPQKD